MSGPCGLLFEPADRTKGGHQYRIMYRLPEPTKRAFPIIGHVFYPQEGWRQASWTEYGRVYKLSKRFDLVPKPPEPHERWGNVYLSNEPPAIAEMDFWKVIWHPSREKAEAAWKAKDFLFRLHEIRQGDDVRYEIVGDE